ncbi:MAG: NAD-glutamate dehydrogenase, partial [Rickettsiales bacterium]|nr:NAD-glutamate dehydrogenase [Rickettsiales bacterium]
LGIFHATAPSCRPMGLSGLPISSLQDLKHPKLLEISKSSRKSKVHRSSHMDYIGIKHFNEKGTVIGEFRILGLFTSTVYFQSATLIPIIRGKIAAVVNRAGFRPNSHNGKTLLTILESYPRDELLQIDEDELFSISMGILELLERPQPRLFVRRDRFTRFTSCLVFIPRERFNTSIRLQTQRLLEESFAGEVTDYYIQLGDSPLVRVHFVIRSHNDTAGDTIDTAAIQDRLLEITSSWVDGLHHILTSRFGGKEGEGLYRAYVDAFNETYRNHHSAAKTVHDIAKIEEAYRTNDLAIDLYARDADTRFDYHLKLFYPEQITLSDILPILENLGFHAVDEFSYHVTPKERPLGMWVMHFRLRLAGDVKRETGKGSDALVKSEFEEALFHIWHNNVGNDPLNTLILYAQLPWRDVVVLRTYSKYLRQIGFTYSHEYMAEVLAKHPSLARKLVDFFHLRFAQNYTKARANKADAIRTAIENDLANVTNVAEDRVIRQFLETIQATLRTNFFQKNAEGTAKSYISIKLNSTEVPNLPLPHPYVEVFVYSHQVEGIHLRGGKVARGGLRWSDRKEDFRTEILGLVKAQMVKNSVIVPVGSKGGFVVKYPVQGSREEILAQGVECYKIFLRGLLDITDNIVNSKILPPRDVVRHDADDPYLVVAADKGTATFSDIANGLSEEYGFWLGDAFASGGSAGYDHKKMGITARGAWVSVQRHFQEMGIDIQKEDFTVVGIGDMSGDVFGNGMLLSKHIRLLSAFNHLHIFVDPNPDAATSFKERQRLFKLPRSTWEDYDKSLLSKGAAIYSRHAKSLTLIKEIQERFDITQTQISPDELIRRLLTAEVDLIWNGGIGTYVKASGETNEQVGDKTNDALRVNASKLRCKVVGEGGNLGLTQLGRIEYALAGGHINTDAIDNSGGVDCSDHEVNMKIALRRAIESGKLSAKKRDPLLLEMTDEVAELVLRNNFLQTQCLTISEQHGKSLMEPLSMLMRALEREGMLNRTIEFLPDDEALNMRRVAGKGLSRPELAVLLAYSKLHLYNDLIKSHLPDDPYFLEDLTHYFPTQMRTLLGKDIARHELKRELVATIVANSVVNRAGIAFYHQMREETGTDGCNIARSYTAVRDAFSLRDLWHNIEALAGKISAKTQVEMFGAIEHLIEHGTLWLLRNLPKPLDVSAAVNRFRPGIETLSKSLNSVLAGPLGADLNQRMEALIAQSVPKKLASAIASLDALASAFDIVQVAQTSKLDIAQVASVYYEVGVRLELNWLRSNAARLMSDSYWNRLSVRTLVQHLYDQQTRLTSQIIATHRGKFSASQPLANWQEKQASTLQRYDQFIQDLRKQEGIDLAMLIVAADRLKAI